MAGQDSVVHRVRHESLGERISWNEPIPMFEIRIPTNSASRQEPNAIVRQPKTNRIAFGMFSVLARTMLMYERLER
jgi:hypothetical protein